MGSRFGLCSLQLVRAAHEPATWPGFPGCSAIVAGGNVSRLDISCNINRAANALGQRCLTPVVRENFAAQVGRAEGRASNV